MRMNNLMVTPGSEGEITGSRLNLCTLGAKSAQTTIIRRILDGQGKKLGLQAFL